MANYGHILFYSLVGGVFSLIGGVLLLSRQSLAEKLARIATPFAAGALLAATFFDLLPESIEHTAAGAATRWALAGILIFFFLEYFLHWFHHHYEHEDKEKSVTAPLIIIGDSIHNFLDGIAIGAAFLINVPTGIVAAVAVAAHEIPQEIGDFGLLLKAGYKRQNVVLINIASALMATIGALLTFWLGSHSSLPVGELLAVTAGMFIYIAASDLIPAIHNNNKGKKSATAVILLVMGVLLVAVTTEIAHEYIEPGHDQDIVCTEAPCDEAEHHEGEPGHERNEPAH